MRTIRRRTRLSSDSIYQFITRCRSETTKCKDAHAYLAAVVLLGTTLEYILAAWIRAFPIVVYSRNRRLTERWGLEDLNKLAYEEELFDFGAFQGAERIRKFRNMVHPNWYAGRKPIRLTKKVLDERISDFNEIVDSIKEWL